MQEHSFSFPPIEGDYAHTLILGTMPGQASLSASQYYAHPRNAFWPKLISIIDGGEASYEITKKTDYRSRTEKLERAGFAVWDVLESCERPGSLDSNIKKTTEVANDIVSLVHRHPELSNIVCNGRTAETLFNRHIKKLLPRFASTIDNQSHHSSNESIRVTCVPSSSPAMASLSLTEKQKIWAATLTRKTEC